MLWLFVLVEFKFKVVAVLFDEFLVGLLLDDFSVLNDYGLDGWWVHVDFLLLFVVVLGFLLFLIFALRFLLLISMVSFTMFTVMVLVVMVSLNYIFSLEILFEFFFFGLDFLFEFDFLEMLVL
jgi:hypothetical protein